MATVVWNGVEIGAGDVKVEFLGMITTDIEEIKYSVKQEKKNEYGLARNPTGRSYGKVEYELEITMSMRFSEQIRAKMPKGAKLIDIPPFPMAMSFVNTAYQSIKHKISFAEFLDEGVAVKSGDGKLMHSYKMICGQIDFS
jgi:hypothetical protein